MSSSKQSQYIGEILDYFGAKECSDIHLSPVRGLWFVKDKSTLPYDEMPTIEPALIDSLVAEFIHGGRSAFDLESQGDASFDIGGKYRGRLAARQTLEGITLTIRIISREIPTVEKLKLPQSLVDLFRHPGGLILLTGQTGSGKSTTIASLVNKVNLEDPAGIYTLESPIEYVYPHGKALVNQREIGSHVSSFAAGIENAKRSHPRIIVVGEILDAETARAVLVAAESGHIVVSTMHAGSTAESIDGLVSMFPPNEQALVRTQLAQVLLAVVVQNLVPKPISGMAMAQEIAFNTRQFSELILGSDMKLAEQMLNGAGREFGMVSMESSLTTLVASGDITLDMARRNARSPKSLETFLTTAGITDRNGTPL